MIKDIETFLLDYNNLKEFKLDETINYLQDAVFLLNDVLKYLKNENLSRI